MKNQTVDNEGTRMCNIYNVFRNEKYWIAQSATIISITLCVFAFIANCVLAIALVRTKQIKPPTLLIFCLSVVDMMVGLFMAVAIPFALSTKYNEGFDPTCLATATLTFVTGFLTQLSSALTVLLAVQRYNHMRPNPVQTSFLTKLFILPYVVPLVLVVILFSLSFPMIHFMGAHYKAQLHIYQLAFAIFYFGIILMVSCVYTKGYLRVTRFVDQSPIYQNNDGIVARPLYVRRLFKTVLALLIILLFNHLPTTIGNILVSMGTIFNIRNNTGARIVLSFAMPSILVGPCLHPIVVLRYNTEAMAWVRRCCTFRAMDIQEQN